MEELNLIEITIKEAKRGDYVSFDLFNSILYTILDIDKDYILIDEGQATLWNKKEYIHKIYRIKKEGK